MDAARPADKAKEKAGETEKEKAISGA
jgi:hypothetical protein